MNELGINITLHHLSKVNSNLTSLKKSSKRHNIKRVDFKKVIKIPKSQKVLRDCELKALEYTIFADISLLIFN